MPRGTRPLTLGVVLSRSGPDGIAQLSTEIPIIRVAEPAGPEVLDELAALRDRARLDQRTRASKLAHLAALPYDEYVALARARTTRDYLLALLHRHRGVVAEAAREAACCERRCTG